MPTTTRKQTPAQARKAALESDYAPFYAVAGLTEVVANTVRAGLANSQERANQRLAELQDKRAAQAKANAEEFNALLRSLPEQLKALPETTRAKIAQLQRQAQDLAAELNVTYGDLAGRGKRLVDDTVIDVRHFSGKAEQRAEDLRADAVDAVDPAFEKVQETVTQARKAATGRTATETTTPKSTAKSTATRARKATAKKTPAKKASTSPQAAAKKTAAKKAPAKKTPAKKAAATETAATTEPSA